MSSKVRMAVSLAWLPSFSSLRLTWKPGVSVGTTMSDIPRKPRSPLVRASRVTKSACVPLVIHILLPLMM